MLLLPFLVLNGLELDYNVQKPSKLFIGTPFNINIEIYSELNDTIYTTEIDTLDIFILKGDILQNEIIEQDQKITNLNLTFQPFDVGEYTFPELEFTVKSGEKLERLSTDPFQVIIHTVLADSSSVIRDIAPPVSVRLGFWDFFLPIAAILVIILIIHYLRKIIKLKEKPEFQEQEVSDSRPAYIIALGMMKDLKESGILTKGDFLEFYFQLSYILRFFLERQYRFNALEMTSYEIKQVLRMEDKKLRSSVIDYLRSADLVKFAKQLPASSEAENKYDWLYDFLKSFESMNVKPSGEDTDA
jgi:hypothetical protein